jgi:class 3 adenylate cyclase
LDQAASDAGSAKYLSEFVHEVRRTPDASSATFMFADIAGFTALTEAHGDEEAAELVADFADAVPSSLHSPARRSRLLGRGDLA